MNLKRYFIGGFIFSIFFVAGTALSKAADSGLKITEMAVTTKIVRGNPIDSIHRISTTSVNALYCFTRLRSVTGEETVIHHIWYKNDEKVGEFDLPVKGVNWRTYSKKSIEKGWVGNWRVEAIDSNGQILKTVKFRMN